MDRRWDAKDVETVSDKIPRKLLPEEREKTCSLYDLIFSEQPKAFVDYYYGEIVPGSEIYGITDQGNILSMIHLRPCEVMVGEKECRVPYGAAAVTHPRYRHQGLMSVLFRKTMRELWMEKVPFLFMPVENRSRFWGFSCIYRQNCMELKVKEYLGKEKLRAYPAGYADVPDLSWISSRILSSTKGTYIKRTEEFYEKMLEMQECRDGEVAVLTKDDMICGWFFTSPGKNIPKVHEAVVREGMEQLLLSTVADCFRYDDTVQLSGFQDSLMGGQTEKIPGMMGRIVSLSAYVDLIKKQIPENYAFGFTDQWIPENNGVYRVCGGRLVKCEDEPGIPVFCCEEFLDKFPLPGPVFLNELL